MTLLNRNDYTVVWIAPLECEAQAALLFLDRQHEGYFATKHCYSHVYHAGDVCGYNVIIATLPAGQEYGASTATALVKEAIDRFPELKFGLLVGIAAGTPQLEKEPLRDIRLGDVLVALPQDDFPAVTVYDLGKDVGNGPLRLLRGGYVLDRPPMLVRAAIGSIKLQEPERALRFYRQVMERKPPNHSMFDDPGQDNDTFHHFDESGVESPMYRQHRPDTARSKVWYGTIGSGSKLIRNADERDTLRKRYNLIGLEMEAAGVMNQLPCAVIRGVSDYADAHKNDKWKSYAAAMAAAYAKAILAEIPPTQKRVQDTNINGTIRGTKRRFSQLSITNGAQVSGNSDRGVHGSTDETRDESPTLEKRQALLDSLEFDQIDSRRAGISDALANTCQWLLNTPEYISWLDPSELNRHGGFIWIKGKPGAGKSTLIKFALKATRKTMTATLISFFFNARGANLEKTTTGMYRSLLFQLLQSLPHLQTVLDSCAVTGQSGASLEWDLSLLKRTFKRAIQSLGRSHLVCFIDALDECEELQIRDMISYFEDIGEFATSQDLQFRVCLSSRYYPHITISRGLSIDLRQQDGHTRDIERYVNSKLKIGSGKLVNDIRSDVIKKAAGVFMWIILVVPILQRSFDRGKIHELRERLRDIPGDLHTLFRDILTRDSEDRDEQLLCIQWVLFAKQPLRPKQLHLAILFERTKQPSSEINSDDSHRFILSCSKGLTELTKGSKTPTVQFIHESVRDFLLKDNGLKHIWVSSTDSFQGQSHDRLKQFCLDYIDSASQFPVDDFSGSPKQQMEQARKAADQDFPCLEYAVHSVFYHADSAQGSGVSQVNFMQSFPLQWWVKLSNSFERYSVRKYESTPSFLYLLAEKNAGHLIDVQQPDRLSSLRIEESRYGTPLLAALATGSCDAAAALMQVGAQGAAATALIHDIIQAYGPNASSKPAIRYGFKYKVPISLAHNLIAADDALVLEFLLLVDRAQVDTTDRSLDSLLQYAANEGHELALRPLLKYGADVNVIGEPYSTPLSLAAERGHEKVVRVLLEAGGNVGAINTGGRTPLHYAVTGGNDAIVRLLLNAGADINATSANGATPLSLAVTRSLTIVKTLLNKNVDIDLADRDGRTPLSLAITHGGDLDDVIMSTKGVTSQDRRRIVSELVAHGADIHARDAQGRSPLWWAKNFLAVGFKGEEICGPDTVAILVNSRHPARGSEISRTTLVIGNRLE